MKISPFPHRAGELQPGVTSLTIITTDSPNATAEGLNSRIQAIKADALRVPRRFWFSFVCHLVALILSPPERPAAASGPRFGGA
jgi:hypothetical protein